MTNPQVGAQRHASDSDERRRLLRQQLEQPQTADEYEDEYEDEELEEPERPSRRTTRRRSPRRRSRRASSYDTSIVHADTIGMIMTWLIRIISLILLYFS